MTKTKIGDEKAKTDSVEPIETWGTWIGKTLAGTAILTSAGAAGGFLHAKFRNRHTDTGATIGAGIGALSSLGFGKEVYEIASSPFVKRPTHAEQVTTSRSSSPGHQR